MLAEMVCDATLHLSGNTFADCRTVDIGGSTIGSDDDKAVASAEPDWGLSKTRIPLLHLSKLESLWKRDCTIMLATNKVRGCSHNLYRQFEGTISSLPLVALKLWGMMACLTSPTLMCGISKLLKTRVAANQRRVCRHVRLTICEDVMCHYYRKQQHVYTCTSGINGYEVKKKSYRSIPGRELMGISTTSFKAR